MAILTPTKQRPFINPIYGFDIETYDKNKKFYCASLYSEKPIQSWNYKHYIMFKDKQSLIDELKTKKFKSSTVSATNLGFDFFGTFYKKPESSKFKTLFRGSDLLNAFTFIENKNFTLDPKLTKRHKLTFVDTMNYARLGVEKLGKILKIPKLGKPACLGRLPKNVKEEKELLIYNIRDSEISCKALRFLYNSMYSLGASPKMTIASSSMSLFRNKYLKDTYFPHKSEILVDQLDAYFGGRCEAIGRGAIHDYYYYDFNSLYPSVMRDFRYPDPNTLRISKRRDTANIYQFEGISDVTVYCPYMDYPLLPIKYDKKLLFPTGTFRGKYTHVELRKAIEIGYIIKKVHKTMYYKETCTPFKEFVDDLYNLRKRYKSDKNPMEFVTKILLNSLYGKFGQKFLNRDNFVHVDTLSLDEIQDLDFIERVGDYYRIKKTTKPAGFSFPIWACYVTSYARLKLYDAIIQTRPIYYDTDSLITKQKLPISDELGKLKLEMKIDEGVIVRPKFYALKSKGQEYVKLKGLGKRITYKEFENLLDCPLAKYTKFMRFKEGVRRGIQPNLIVDTHKEFSLNDQKRSWKSDFMGWFQMSEPFNMIDSIPEHLIKKKQSIETFI